MNVTQRTAATVQETARFRQSFSKALPEILGIDLQPYVHITIFTISADAIQRTPRQVIAFVFLLACRRILLLWKLQKPPRLCLRICNVTWKETLPYLTTSDFVSRGSNGATSRFVSVCDEPNILFIYCLHSIACVL